MKHSVNGETRGALTFDTKIGILSSDERGRGCPNATERSDMTDWSNQIFYTRPKTDPRSQLIELLTQDGFSESELRVPPVGSDELLQILRDSEAFAQEIGNESPGWPVRAVRWLHRITVTVTGKSFSELPSQKREAITHATIVIGGRPEILR